MVARTLLGCSWLLQVHCYMVGRLFWVVTSALLGCSLLFQGIAVAVLGCSELFQFKSIAICSLG